MRFLFDGERLDIDSEEHTPKMLGMEDGDTIECVLSQEGGSF